MAKNKALVKKAPAALGEDNKGDAAFDAQFAAAQAAIDWSFAKGPADRAVKAEALHHAAREYARLADIAWGGEA